MIRPSIKRIIKDFIRKQLSGHLAFDTSELRLQLGIGHLLANRSNYKSMRNLWDAEVSVFSQWGEDGIIDFLLQSIDLSKPRLFEIGAGDFSQCNSRFTLQFRNCSAYLVDSNSDLKENLSKYLPAWKSTSNSESLFVTPKNVQDLFHRAKAFMGGVDVLSLDVDSVDYWIARQIPLEEVKIAIFEYNPIFGAEKSITVPETEVRSRFEIHPTGLIFGASIRAWINLMNSKGFTFVGSNRVGNNAFFVNSSLSPKVQINLPSTSDLYPFVDWRIRDARNRTGTFDFKSPIEIDQILAQMPLWDLEKNSTTLWKH